MQETEIYPCSVDSRRNLHRASGFQAVPKACLSVCLSVTGSGRISRVELFGTMNQEWKFIIFICKKKETESKKSMACSTKSGLNITHD